MECKESTNALDILGSFYIGSDVQIALSVGWGDLIRLVGLKYYFPWVFTTTQGRGHLVDEQYIALGIYRIYFQQTSTRDVYTPKDSHRTMMVDV